MKIPIKEVEQSGFTEETLLQSIISLSDFIVRKARKNNPSKAIDNIEGYFLLIVEKILVQAQTTLDVISQRKDYNTVCALVRLLADNICIIKLIYNEVNPYERELRHYLYLLDGLMMRKTELEKPHKPYDETIPRETFDGLMKQMKEALDNTNEAISVCTVKIHGNPLTRKYAKTIDVLIRKKNWQYRNLDSNPADKLKWQEIYKESELIEPSIYSFMSQYVHGLSISNLPTESEDDFDAPCSFAVSLIGTLFVILRNKYENITATISHSELIDILSYCPEEYLSNLLGKLKVQEPL